MTLHPIPLNPLYMRNTLFSLLSMQAEVLKAGVFYFTKVTLALT
jgi:hypothetical protein